jgi:hypothetical protein
MQAIQQGRILSVLKLTQDSLQVRAADSSTVLFVRVAELRSGQITDAVTPFALTERSCVDLYAKTKIPHHLIHK